MMLVVEDGGQLLVRVGGWSNKTKVILNSTQFKLVEVGVELGNIKSAPPPENDKKKIFSFSSSGRKKKKKNI